MKGAEICPSCQGIFSEGGLKFHLQVSGLCRAFIEVQREMEESRRNGK